MNYVVKHSRSSNRITSIYCTITTINRISVAHVVGPLKNYQHSTITSASTAARSHLNVKLAVSTYPRFDKIDSKFNEYYLQINVFDSESRIWCIGASIPVSCPTNVRHVRKVSGTRCRKERINVWLNHRERSSDKLVICYRDLCIAAH